MKIIELINELKSFAAIPVDETKTCDTVKSGDPEAEITKVGTTMFATPDVIRKAAEKGINFLIVHEPTYHTHMDDKVDDFISNEKKKLIEETGITIFRYHDFAHLSDPDLICEGELTALELDGQLKKGVYLGTNSYILDEEISAVKLAKRIEEKLGIKHVRIAGNPQAAGRKIACSFGTPGHLETSLADNDIVITGEICEWGLGEMTRDYAQLGYNKAVLVLGHIGSERAGMMLLAERLTELHPEIETEYIECGELYSYTDEFEV